MALGKLLDETKEQSCPHGVYKQVLEMEIFWILVTLVKVCLELTVKKPNFSGEVLVQSMKALLKN